MVGTMNYIEELKQLVSRHLKFGRIVVKELSGVGDYIDYFVVEKQNFEESCKFLVLFAPYTFDDIIAPLVDMVAFSQRINGWWMVDPYARKGEEHLRNDLITIPTGKAIAALWAVANNSKPPRKLMLENMFYRSWIRFSRIGPWGEEFESIHSSKEIIRFFDKAGIIIAFPLAPSFEKIRTQLMKERRMLEKRKTTDEWEKIEYYAINEILFRLDPTKAAKDIPDKERTEDRPSQKAYLDVIESRRITLNDLKAMDIEDIIWLPFDDLQYDVSVEDALDVINSKKGSGIAGVLHKEYARFFIRDILGEEE